MRSRNKKFREINSLVTSSVVKTLISRNKCRFFKKSWSRFTALSHTVALTPLPEDGCKFIVDGLGFISADKRLSKARFLTNLSPVFGKSRQSSRFSSSKKSTLEPLEPVILKELYHLWLWTLTRQSCYCQFVSKSTTFWSSLSWNSEDLSWQNLHWNFIPIFVVVFNVLRSSFIGVSHFHVSK